MMCNYPGRPNRMFSIVLEIMRKIRSCFTAIGAHFAFLRECFARRGIMSSCVNINRCPRQFFWGFAPNPTLVQGSFFDTHAA